MNWFKNQWRKRAAKASRGSAEITVTGGTRYDLDRTPISDKQLDVLLDSQNISRRDIYDVWTKEMKDAAFPNDPNEVWSFCAKNFKLTGNIEIK